MSGGIFGSDEMGTLVFDVGEHSFRAGFAGEDCPKTIIPSTIGYIDDILETKFNENGKDFSNRKYIFDTPGIKCACSNMELSSFLKEGMIDNWDLFEKIIDFIYSKQLYLDSTLNPVLFSEASWNTRSKREKLCELMFEKYNIPAFSVTKNAVLAAFANGRSTCVVLDSGHSQTSAVPVHDGVVIQQAIVQSPLAGDFITKQCRQYFNERNIEIVPYYMIASKEVVKEGEPARWSKRNNIPDNLTNSWKEFMINESIHDFKSCALQVSDTAFNKEIAETMPAIHYEFSNGYNIDLTADRFRIPEALFDTSQIKGVTSTMMGMSQIVTTSIGLCDIDIRSSLHASVLVTGGNTLINGFTERLNRDLTTKTPASMKYKLIIPHSTIERRYGTWIGGSILGSMNALQQFWVSKQEYEEEGKGQVERKCP